MDVLILAGGRCPPELAARTGAQFRADLPFAGRTMLQIVRDAVAGLGKVTVVGPDSDVAPGDSFLASLEAGMAKIDAPSFLLVTADMPFVSSEAIRDFVERCDVDALLNYPIVPVASAESLLPGVPRTTLRLREGEFTGGNAVVVNTELMRRVLPRLNQAYEARKNPVQLGRMFGLGLLARILVSRVAPSWVSVQNLEAEVSQALGGQRRAIQLDSSEIAADIDSDEQYTALQQHQATRS